MEKFSAAHNSIGFDSNSNLIVFQTSNISSDSYQLTGYKFPYDAGTGKFGDISTIADINISDSSDGLMKFVADDTGNGYVLGIFMGALLTDKMIDIQVPADCTEDGATPSYFYFMDTCFKTKAIQQKVNQLVVYRYDSQQNSLTPIDSIPLMGWMGNWDDHNYSATFDRISKKFVIGVNQEDTTYPSVLARYSVKNGEITKEYLDVTGIPLGSNEFYLASSNDAVTVGMWAYVSGPTRGYALGSTIYRFSPDIPATPTYGTPACTYNMPTCSGGNTVGILACDSYGSPLCGAAAIQSNFQLVCDPYSGSVKCQSSGAATPICGNSVVESGEECDAGNSNGLAGSECNAFCKKVVVSDPYSPPKDPYGN